MALTLATTTTPETTERPGPSIEAANGWLTIRLPIDPQTVRNARLSSSGKAKLVASISDRVAVVDGHTLRLSLNLMRNAD